MKRPLLIVAISYLIGIIIGVYFKISIPLFVLALIITFIYYIKPKLKRPENRNILKAIILSTAIIIIASIQTIYLNNKYDTLYKPFEEQEILLVGTICSDIRETDYKYSVTIKIDNVNKNNKYKNTKLILSIKKSKNGDDLNKIKYGNKIILTGTYEKPTGQRNYKGFSYKNYLKTKQIYGIVNIENLTNVKVIKANNLNILQIQVNKLSEKLKQNLKQILPEETASLAQGILLGDSSDIDEQIKDNFKNCNLSHMLAVSGTHLSYLVLGLSLILNKKILGIKNTKIIAIITIIIFMLITNMSPSVTRAGVSVILGIIATLIHRKQDTFTTISFALLFSLIQNPFSIFNIGMQLSYMGTIGIILFYSKIEGKIKPKEQNNNIVKKEKITKNEHLTIKNKIINEKIANYIISSISTTLSANILIFPLTIYNFNTISLNFIISNLITSPILGICIILGLFTLVISTISVSIAKILSIPLNILLNTLIKITNIIAKIPFANITIITPHIITIVVIYLIIAVLYITKSLLESKGLTITEAIQKTKEKIDKIKVIKENNIHDKNKLNPIIKNYQKIIALIILIVITISILTIYNPNSQLKIYFIDVGQGDSTLICTQTGKNILVDGGGNRNPENYDVGEKVLLPYLLDRRIKKLDYIIVSHFDADHAQGLEAVIENIKVKNIIVSKQASDSAEYNTIIELCKKNNVKIIVVKRGTKIGIDKYTYIEILHPGDQLLDDGKGGLNANAIVAKLYYKINNMSYSKYVDKSNATKVQSMNQYFTILFTGDIEQDAEAELVKIYGEKLKSDILKVAHHGSKTSSTKEFIQAVSPKISLIGVGKDNTFGHPNQQVLERLQSINTRIYRTDLNGEIAIKINKQGKVKIDVKNDTS